MAEAAVPGVTSGLTQTPRPIALGDVGRYHRAMHVGLSLMLDDAFRDAAMPLFEAGKVGALEYGFELGWARPRPAWAGGLLDFYGAQGRLWGHGVTYSPLSEDAPLRHGEWMAQVERDCAALQLQGVSEHYGFMGVDGVNVGAPLPPPPVPEVVEAGTAAMGALKRTLGLPVGLENLAMGLSPDDVEAQPRLLSQILDAVDGYLVLDLHNLWCQAVNFGVDPIALMDAYPLARTRVMHVSGGSWSSHGAVQLRRDTHDGRVPDPVFTLLAEALSRCTPQVVLLEQLGPTLADSEGARGYRLDFERLCETCGNDVG